MYLFSAKSIHSGLKENHRFIGTSHKKSNNSNAKSFPRSRQTKSVYFFVCDSFYGEPHIVDSKYKHILKDANKQGNFRLGKRKSSCTMNLHALHYDIIIELEII